MNLTLLKQQKSTWLLAGFGLILLALVIIWFMLASYNDRLKTQINTAHEAIPWMQQVVSGLKANPSVQGAAKKDDKTLAFRTSFLMQQFALEGVKLKASGDNKVRLDFTKTNFIRLHDVLFNLEHIWGAQVISANFKTGAKGQVRGDLLLQR